MLKLLFWILLLGNGALYAYHQGYLDSLILSGREPARLAQQLNAGKIRLLPADAGPADPPLPANPSIPSAPADKPASEQAPDKAGEATKAASADLAGVSGSTTQAGKLTDAALNPDNGKKAEAENKPEPEKAAESSQKAAVAANLPATAGKKTDLLACTEIGNFSEADAGRIESRLAALAPGGRLARRAVREASSHMVYIPAQGSKDNADRKVEQLRGLGVTDFYVIQDQSEMRWGISLGVFSTEESARKRLEQLKQQGVRTARIGPRSTVGKVAFQLRGLDGAGREKLEKFKSDFPQQLQRDCT